MIRGFVTGVLWGGVVAGIGLAVVSQVARPPVGLPEAVPVVAAPDAVVVPEVSPVADAADLAPVPKIAPVAKPAPTSGPIREPAPEPLPAAVEPAPLPAAEPASETAPSASPASPDAPAMPEAETAAPALPLADNALAPDAMTTDALTPPATPDMDAAPLSDAAPPPAPPEADEALLQPKVAALPDPAPARIAPDPIPELLPDPAPQPQSESANVPEPDPRPDAVVDAEPLPTKIDDGAPSTLSPDPGLAFAPDGLATDRLPKIGQGAEPEVEAATATPVEDLPPVRRYARTFDNPAAKPLFAVILSDTGDAEIDRTALAQISFPVTFVIDPASPDAAARTKIYRDAGQEVLLLATGIAKGATPGDLEQAFQSHATTLPEAVGIIDLDKGGFQNNRPLSTQVVPILMAQGRGLVTFDQGLNAADQEARRAGLPAATIFRRLDAEGETSAVIRRYLDRAAFKAAQEGRVLVIGDARPETITALLEWAVEGRAAAVALAPVTALLRSE